jgi:hypothetical protein
MWECLFGSAVSNKPLSDPMQDNRVSNLESRMHAAEERLRQLEAHIHYPNTKLTAREQDVAIREAAVRVDTAPMRSDVETIMALKAFAERLGTGGDLYWHVSGAVNLAADKALGRVK